MKKKMIIAVLTMSMVLGAGSASYAAEKAASCTDTAEYGQTMTAVSALRCADGARISRRSARDRSISRRSAKRRIRAIRRTKR